MNAGKQAWKAFISSQTMGAQFEGCISQPAHAVLAGELALALNGHLLEAVPEEVLETIRGHDIGWSETDLAALEGRKKDEIISFVSAPSATAVRAWRKSIGDATSKSSLSAYVVRSHFCLLAPRDGDGEHQQFLKEEETQLSLLGIEKTYNDQDLERFIAFLGFCDLLSLHLCSGWDAEFELPLAHPAHPSSEYVRQVAISIREGFLHVDGASLPKNTGVRVSGWEKTSSGALHSRRYGWIFH